MTDAFSDERTMVRSRIAAIYTLSLSANLVIWAWALMVFRDYPVPLGTGFLAYTFGLRHAVDAAPIAAIDNVMRKLMQEGKQPVAGGFFFSLGHSTVVVLSSVAIAATTTAQGSRFESFREIGGLIGTSILAIFLFIVAAENLCSPEISGAA